MNPRRFLTSRNSAFTQVELLVTIGIIGLLTAIVVPSISHIRSQAQSSRCLSNLRHIGISLNLYANQNRGLLPASTQSDPNGTGTVSWWVLIQRQIDGPDLPAAGTESVLLCPSADNTYPETPTPRRSYGLSMIISGSTSTPYRLNQVPSPSQTILVGETIHNANGDGWSAFNTVNNAQARLDWRHRNDSINILLADLSVKTLRKAETSIDQYLLPVR
jgi:type II secretory pathway pseudopilin PulG